jgi:hypothetical protein
MSGLTNYLTLDGTDLSYVFHPILKRTFTNAITVHQGIRAPSTSISYSAGMIGYITAPSTTTQSTVTSGAILSILNFPLTPGLYLCHINTSNLYSSTTGTLTSMNVGISSSNNATSSDGFWVKTVSDRNLPIPSSGNNRWILGILNIPHLVTTTTTFYLIQTIIFSSVSVSNNGGGGTSYIKCVRVG